MNTIAQSSVAQVQFSGNSDARAPTHGPRRKQSGLSDESQEAQRLNTCAQGDPSPSCIPGRVLADSKLRVQTRMSSPEFGEYPCDRKSAVWVAQLLRPLGTGHVPADMSENLRTMINERASTLTVRTTRGRHLQSLSESLCSCTR